MKGLLSAVLFILWYAVTMIPVKIRKESTKNAVLVASYGTFSTGVSVNRLHHIVLASPSKSRYRVLQSIGRGLRLHSSKKTLYLHDIIDDASDIKYNNYALKHWKVRAKFYVDELFPVDMFEHTVPEVKKDSDVLF